MALKFVEHFLYICAAMERGDGMWDDEDGFFYDQLRLPDGSGQRLRVRSMVGLIPLCAVTVVPKAAFGILDERLAGFMARHPDLLGQISDPLAPGVADRRLLTLLNEDRLRSVLGYLLDEDEFLSPHGIRALSRYHLDHPFSMEVDGQTFGVGYLPGESDSGMFGGNSNWRGPVWMPVNFMIIRALLQYYLYYGDEFTVEMPTGSGHQHTLFEVAHEIADRLVSIFLPDERRPAPGVRRRRAVPVRRALARQPVVLRVLPRRQRRRHRRIAPDRLDRAGGEADPALRDPRRGHRARRRAVAPLHDAVPARRQLISTMWPTPPHARPIREGPPCPMTSTTPPQPAPCTTPSSSARASAEPSSPVRSPSAA